MKYKAKVGILHPFNSQGHICTTHIVPWPRFEAATTEVRTKCINQGWKKK